MPKPNKHIPSPRGVCEEATNHVASVNSDYAI